MSEQEFFKDEDLIYAYTADQALEDGVLVAVDEKIAKEAGFLWPVRLSIDVNAMVTPNRRAQARGESYNGRLWDVLWMAHMAMVARKRAGTLNDTMRVPFKVKIGGRVPLLLACMDTTSGPGVNICTPSDR